MRDYSIFQCKINILFLIKLVLIIFNFIIIFINNCMLPYYYLVYEDDFFIYQFPFAYFVQLTVIEAFRNVKFISKKKEKKRKKNGIGGNRGISLFLV